MRNRYHYDAWGNVIVSGGGGRTYMYVGQYGYYSHYQEPSLALLQLGVRYYDPALGRFTQRDPVGAELSWYAYGSDSPLGAVDPQGLLTYRDAVSLYLYWWSGVGLTQYVRLEDVNWGVDPVQSSPRLVRRLSIPGCRTEWVHDSYPYRFPGFTPEAIIFGNVTLRLAGTLRVGHGEWTFDGYLRLLDNTYDFNSSLRLRNARGIIGSIAVGIGGLGGWLNPSANHKDFLIRSNWMKICQHSHQVRVSP